MMQVVSPIARCEQQVLDAIYSGPAATFRSWSAQIGDFGMRSAFKERAELTSSPRIDSTIFGDNNVSLSSRHMYEKFTPRASANSPIDAYSPHSSNRLHRKARARALTIASCT